jgi:hypothetical protein
VFLHFHTIKQAYKGINQRFLRDKDSKAYKVTEYYYDLITGKLDEGGTTLVRSELLNIEKDLKKWSDTHPNGGTIMQPEESALILINDLRERGF